MVNDARRRQRLFDILENRTPADGATRAFGIFMVSLITLNVVVVILETVKRLAFSHGPVFRAFDTFSVMVFTIEYAFRLWSCTSDEQFRHPVAGRLRYAVTPLAVIDLLAIAPFYVLLAVPMHHLLDLRFLRAIRLLRLFRMLKMARYSRALKTFGDVVSAKKEELLVSAFAVLILLVVASGLMYFVENAAQPDAFSSIPAAMWWGVATLTTVGYGDMYPVTPLGKFLGAVIALLGIGVFALPTGILAGAFADEITKKRAIRVLCPHCGKDFECTNGKSSRLGRWEA
jgi:voltage-gated potassium channel